MTEWPTDETPCEACGHPAGEHERQSWYDEEGVEGTGCTAENCGCKWSGWDWDPDTNVASQDTPS